MYHRDRATVYFKGRARPVLSFHTMLGNADWDATTFNDSYSESHGWDGSGHCIHIENPNELASVMIRWIDGLPAN